MVVECFVIAFSVCIAYHEYCQGKRGPRNETVESTTEDVAECSGEEEEGDSDVEIQQVS